MYTKPKTRAIKVILSIFLCLALTVGAFPGIPAYLNTFAEETLADDKMTIVPENGIYYGGNTYVVFFVQDSAWTWERQQAFCEALGNIAGVKAHLATIESSEENSAILKLINKTIGEGPYNDRPYDANAEFAIGASETNGTWKWVDGKIFGRQPYIYDDNGQIIGSTYLSSGYDDWCIGTHGDMDHSGRAREPNIWHGPYCDQHYAYMSINGWHNEVNLGGASFICEFECEVCFAYADVNYDMDYFNQSGLYPEFQDVYKYNPGIYLNIGGGYSVAKPMLRSELLTSFSAGNPLVKQQLGQYPVHPEKHFNFHGWAYKAYGGQTELFGHKTKEPVKIWDYNSREPFEFIYEDPILVLHATWEDAADWSETKEEKDAATYLAMCRFAYVLGNDSEGPYNGQSIGEVLNAFYYRGNDTKDLAKPLPHLKYDEKINTIDFMYATIGGWTVKNREAGDKSKMEEGKSGWSFFATAIENNTGTNSVVYRGTIPGADSENLDSFKTDKLFGMDGTLNTQFQQAIDFFRCNSDERTFAVGHSLGGALASHVALTLDVNAHTYNSAEGWTIPLTIRDNYLTHDFVGNDKLDNLDPWIYTNDQLVGTHSISVRSRHEINMPKNPLALLENHGIEIALAYENGKYSIGKSKFIPYDKAWDYFTGTVGTALNSEQPSSDNEIYLGTSDDDEFRAQTSHMGMPSGPSHILAFGGAGNDMLVTGTGNDTLIGGTGSNTLMGGRGKDEYIIRENPNGLTGIEDPDYTIITVVNLDIVELPTKRNDYVMRLSDGQIVTFDAKTIKHTVIRRCIAPEFLAWDKEAKPQYWLVWKADGVNYDEITTMAKPTSSGSLVNGKSVGFDSYNINDNNYFKLRDLAYVLSGTEKQFEVAWDDAANAIMLTSGQPYTKVGGELTGKSEGNTIPLPTSSRIFLDGKEVTLTAYNIEGNNYFKLRDIGAIFDFDVTWDGAKNTIVIDTSAGYTPD